MKRQYNLILAFLQAESLLSRVLQVWVYIGRLRLHDEACTATSRSPATTVPGPFHCAVLWMQMEL